MNLRRTGFTLVEIMVSMAVLALLGLIVVQVINATAQAIRASSHIVDAAAQARLAFDRIGRDVSNLVKRPDNVLVVSSTAPNLLFISGVNSAAKTGSPAGSNRGVSVIAYEVAASNSNGNRLCLQRSGRALLWSDVGFLGLDNTGYPVSVPAAQQPAASDYDVLSAGVIGMQVGFQLYPDNQPATLADGTSIANAQGQVVYSPPLRTDTGTTKIVDVTRIGSLVVGLVVIDLNTLTPLSATQVSSLAGAFTPATANLPLSTWGPIADNALSLPSSVPLSARQAVRVYQRLFPITAFGSKASP